MFPIFTRKNISDRPSGYVEFEGDLGNGELVFKRSNFYNFTFDQLMHSVFRTPRYTTSMGSISHVFHLCAKREVLRVATRRIVTAMKNSFAEWNRFIGELIGYAMGRFNQRAGLTVPGICIEHAISKFMRSFAYPWPAGVGTAGAIHFFPEAIFNRPWRVSLVEFYSSLSCFVSVVAATTLRMVRPDLVPADHNFPATFAFAKPKGFSLPGGEGLNPGKFYNREASELLARDIFKITVCWFRPIHLLTGSYHSLSGGTNAQAAYLA